MCSGIRKYASLGALRFPSEGTKGGNRVSGTHKKLEMWRQGCPASPGCHGGKQLLPGSWCWNREGAGNKYPTSFSSCLLSSLLRGLATPRRAWVMNLQGSIFQGTEQTEEWRTDGEWKCNRTISTLSLVCMKIVWATPKTEQNVCFSGKLLVTLVSLSPRWLLVIMGALSKMR